MKVLLLSRPDCHLCHQLRAVAEPVLAERGLTLVEQDVRSEPRFSQYLNEIPVLLYEDRELARHRVSAEDLRRRLDTLLPVSDPS